jgi:hypothetical protein
VGGFYHITKTSMKPNLQDLHIASDYFEYHVRMYVETLQALDEHPVEIFGWNTKRNAILESHLVHARALIDFVCKTQGRRTGDVWAGDYIKNGDYIPSDCDELKEIAKQIGGQLVHITYKASPRKKSEQNWPVKRLTELLLPLIKQFLHIVSDDTVAKDVKADCLSHIRKIDIRDLPISINATT